MPQIKSETRDHIRILTISNEPKRNAMEGSMAADLLAQFEACETDARVRAVVVTGGGQVAFCSGHDLAEISSGTHAASGLGETPMLRPMSMKKPVIAAVNGHCYAAALILAMSCDFRIASKNAMFGSPGARLGMLPEGGQIGRLPLLMSRSAALRLMLTGKPLSAADAYQAGFVGALVEPGEALNVAIDLAIEIAANAPAVVSAVKRGVLIGEGQGVAAAEDFEQKIARELEVMPDAVEGVRAFFEKRAPVFTGAA
ncbi:putative enoyl-CoA hydratase/isomerase [Cupriavidus sp. TA19]|uniref:enoyl-CoA hydratase/isomerase family protein n=1 Tax=unclassified Cupriavidus TaxID=2640874 RepID=UPI000E2EF196|nr:MULTISPECIES: enoyl-CoA hydratase/isomerase family protein [unclassified Cupriavidus]BDB30673.1 enoyl-CoA hydratase/isomerase family protein [Cupriavidus sp. P-10]GLC97271.1 putative enoyl-CoA hydratase/isomerase [Cupriavidus sp. TA19]